MPRHAQGQRFDAGQDQKGIERRRGGTEIAQPHDAAGNRKGKIAECLGKPHAVVAGVGLGQRRVFLFRFHPVEGAAIDDDATDRVAVSAHEFGQRMHDDVGTVLLGAAEIRRRQRVVDDQRHAGLFGNGGDGRDVDDDAARIGDALDHDRLGLRRQRLLEARRIGRIRKDHVPAELLEGVVELVDRAAVELASGDEIVARLHQRMERQELCRMARRHNQCRSAAFECCDARLEHALRRVADARVDVAEGFEAEQRRGVIGIIEDVGRGLVDRRDAGAGRGIGGGAGVDGERGKAGGRVLRGHADLPSRAEMRLLHKRVPQPASQRGSRAVRAAPKPEPAAVATAIYPHAASPQTVCAGNPPR